MLQSQTHQHVSAIGAVRDAIVRTAEDLSTAPDTSVVASLQALRGVVAEQRTRLQQALGGAVTEQSLLATITHDALLQDFRPSMPSSGGTRLKTKEDFVAGLAFNWKPPPSLSAATELWARSEGLSAEDPMMLPPNEEGRDSPSTDMYPLSELLFGETLASCTTVPTVDAWEQLSEEASLLWAATSYLRAGVPAGAAVPMDALHNWAVRHSLDALVDEYVAAGSSLGAGGMRVPSTLTEFTAPETRKSLRLALCEAHKGSLLRWIDGLAGLVGCCVAATPLATYVAVVETVVDHVLTGPSSQNPVEDAVLQWLWSCVSSHVVGSGARAVGTLWELNTIEGDLVELFTDAVVHLLKRATAASESETAFSGLSAFLRTLLAIPGKKRTRHRYGEELLEATDRLRYIWSHLLPCGSHDFDTVVLRVAVRDVVVELGCGEDRLEELVELSLSTLAGLDRGYLPPTASPFLPLQSLRFGLGALLAQGRGEPLSPQGIVALAAQVPWVLPHLTVDTPSEARALLLVQAIEVPVFRHAEHTHHICMHAQLMRAAGGGARSQCNVPAPTTLAATLYPLSQQLLRQLSTKEDKGLLAGSGSWKAVNDMPRYVETTTLRTLELPSSVNRWALAQLFGGANPRLPSYYYCPINKVRCIPPDIPSTEADPPCMLACGHVVSRQFCLSSTNHNAARRAPSGAVRCPYCRVSTPDSKVLSIVI